jgi:ribonucleoside-diphosphate reductase alpha chain
MGFADYLLRKEIAYGSDESLSELEFIVSFIYKIAEDESIKLGEELGVPKNCQALPIPRRNITLISIAPTGTISLLADCNSSIEPIFSEITIRNDRTGNYQFANDLSNTPYFRCAVSANGAKEVTWEEHIKVQAAAQKWVDSGVSKTINFPTHTHRDTVANSFMLAWKLGCKGITVYRNNSRKVEVLSPKNLKKDKCPACGKDIIKESGCTKCTDINCGWSLCSV